MVAKSPERTYLDPAWAWAPFEPETARPRDLALAGHLYRRAAFGANWGQLREAVNAGPQEAVSKLLTSGDDATAFSQTYDAYESAESGGESVDALGDTVNVGFGGPVE